MWNGSKSILENNNANVYQKLQTKRQKQLNPMTKKSDGTGSNSYNVNAESQTERGTKIVKYGDNGMDKNAFLQLLVAQMTNMDPTQDQDSTAYVTQMAQFASIEQMNNLNSTMDGFSVRNLIGKHVIVDQYDEKGNTIEGTVVGVQKSNGKNMLAIRKPDGSVYDLVDESKVSGVVEGMKDNNSAISSLNTQFIAASSLKDKRVIIVDEDKDGKTIVIKGKVKGSYIDCGDVKLRIEKLDDDLEETGENAIYSYLDIYKAGNLSDEDMDVKPSDFDDENEENDSVESDS